MAAGVFAALCRKADANGDGERAIAAAERLAALEPTREDRQRTALELLARHKGRESALSRVKLFADLLRNDLGVSPEPATRALIDAIKRGDFEQDSPNREQAPAQGVVKLVPLPEPMPRSLPVPETAPLIPVPISQQFWRRQPLAAAGAIDRHDRDAGAGKRTEIAAAG